MNPLLNLLDAGQVTLLAGQASNWQAPIAEAAAIAAALDGATVVVLCDGRFETSEGLPSAEDEARQRVVAYRREWGIAEGTRLRLHPYNVARLRQDRAPGASLAAYLRSRNVWPDVMVDPLVALLPGGFLSAQAQVHHTIAAAMNKAFGASVLIAGSGEAEGAWTAKEASPLAVTLTSPSGDTVRLGGRQVGPLVLFSPERETVDA